MTHLERLYRWFVIFLPGHIRRTFGASLHQTFRTGLRREWERRGGVRASGWAVRECVDVAVVGMRERMHGLGRRTPRPAHHAPRGHWLARLAGDGVHAVRMLRRAPAYSAIVIVTIVLAVGANAAIFAVVDGVLLRPSPFADSERLVQIHHVTEGNFALYARMGPDRLTAWREQTDVFEHVEGYETQSFVATGESEPERIMASFVSTGLLPMLGVPPLLGTVHILDTESAETVVLSQGLWSRRYGADPEIVGQSILLSGRSYTVVGVMPRRFVFPYAAIEAWLPVPMNQEGLERAGGGLQPLARLQADLPADLAQERVDVVSMGLTETMPKESGWQTRLRPLDASRGAGADTRRALFILLGAVGFVLLIACANVANLTLSAVTARRRELAVRTALGASRRQIRQLLFVQSAVLCAIGGAIALGLAHWTVPYIVGLADDNLTLFADATIQVDGRVTVAVLLLSCLTAILSTAVPAFRFSRNGSLTDLQEGARTVSPTRMQRSVRGALVVAQVGLSLMLLIGAGLLGKSFLRLAAVPLGFETDNTVVFTLQLDSDRLPAPEARDGFYTQLMSRLAAIPGVSDVTMAGGLPPGGGGIVFSVEPEAQGEPSAPSLPDLILPYTNAAHNYFEFFGIPLLEGRAFNNADGNQNVVIVNEAVARHYWGDGSPVGRQFRLEPDDEWMTVVGVAADIKITGPNDRFGAMEIYYPLARRPGLAYREMGLRVSGEVGAIAASVKRAVWAIDPDLPVFGLSTLNAKLADSIARPRFYALIMAGFAVFGIVVAAVGLYGVISYSVVQRTREIGIRMALGAQRAVVLRSVLAGGVALTGVGLVLGLAGATAISGVLESMLFEVETTDPLVIGTVVLGVFGLSVLATLLPAHRASSVDPNIALRAE